MFIAAIKDQYDEVEVFWADTKEDLDRDVEQHIHQNIDTENSVELYNFNMTTHERVTYKLTYENLIPTSKYKSTKQLVEV